MRGHSNEATDFAHLTPERWRQIKDVFFSLLDGEQAARPSILVTKCGGDLRLRADVESLLAAHEALAEADRSSGPRCASSLPAFHGDRRFELHERLGDGGFGVVHRAFDRKLGRWIALKVLQAPNPDAFARFKREFRVIASLRLRNLVRCYELFAEAEPPFFTMELIEGESLLAHLRRPRPDERRDRTGPEQRDQQDGAGGVAAASAYARTSSLFAELARGIMDLHAAGWLHRDLKPANVLVGRDGRVVILDLGLARGLDDLRRRSTRLLGTPFYMAPELFKGGAVTEASDWYSVGVMLYEALTGEMPWSCTWLELGHEKTTKDPAPPRSLAPDLPAALDALCSRLLRRDPERRPDGGEVLRCLAASSGAQEPRRDAGERAAAAPFVGREEHLADLRAAFLECSKGRPSIAEVQGASGMGKTAMVRHFLHLLRRELGDGLVVLEGCCYRHESIPYKAFDGVVDALAEHLKRLPRQRAEALLPRNVRELCRVFPALLQVSAVSESRRRPFDAEFEGLELRRKAFDALRELLCRLAYERPVAVFIDDLQWADRDSVALVGHLLCADDAPPLLLVAAYRSELTDDPLLADFRRAMAAGDATRRTLVVDALGPDEARQLARLLLGARHPAVQAVVQDTAGIPFFIQELAAFAPTGTGENAAVGCALRRLDEVLLARIRTLSGAARALLDVLAVARKPLSRSVAHAVAERGAGGDDAEEVLFAARLARPCRDGESIEPYHDRVREVAEAALTPGEQAEINRRIAAALERSPNPDPSDLAVHFQAAGDKEKAVRYITLAADEAAGLAAFNRAARLCFAALELAGAKSAAAPALLVKLGDAEANAGSGRAAAAAYESAAGLDAVNALELRRRAAEQLLRVGEVDRGLALVQRILGPEGWRDSDGYLAIVGGTLWRRGRLWLRGLGFRARAEHEVPRELLRRCDVARTAFLAMSIVDPLRSLHIQSYHALQALDTGEPNRIALALAIELVFASLRGQTRRCRRLMAAANRALTLHPTPVARGWLSIAGAFTAFLLGRWRECGEQTRAAEQVLLGECTGVYWELAVVRGLAVGALTWSGELGECSRRLPDLLRDAKERGDFFAQAALVLLGSYHVVLLAQDRPEQVVDDLQELGRHWSPRRFAHVACATSFGLAEAALYRGDAAETFLTSGGPLARRALVHAHPLTRIRYAHLRARVAIALALQRRAHRSALLRIAATEARRLRHERDHHARGLAHLVGAGLASLCGDRDTTLAALAAAEHELEPTGTAALTMMSRWLRGHLKPADGGAALVHSAEAWAAAQGIRRFDRMIATYVPGVL